MNIYLSQRSSTDPVNLKASSKVGGESLHNQMLSDYLELSFFVRKRTLPLASSPISTTSQHYHHSMSRTAIWVPNTDKRHETMDGITGPEKTSATGSLKARRPALDGIRSFTRVFSLVEHSARRR